MDQDIHFGGRRPSYQIIEGGRAILLPSTEIKSITTETERESH